VIQELGREGVVPYSEFFASNKPFGAPFPGLFTQYLVSCMFLLLIPPGDAYLFMISRAFLFSLKLDSVNVDRLSSIVVLFDAHQLFRGVGIVSAVLQQQVVTMELRSYLLGATVSRT
jgi:hypothetical protein